MIRGCDDPSVIVHRGRAVQQGRWHTLATVRANACALWLHEAHRPRRFRLGCTLGLIGEIEVGLLRWHCSLKSSVYGNSHRPVPCGRWSDSSNASAHGGQRCRAGRLSAPIGTFPLSRDSFHQRSRSTARRSGGHLRRSTCPSGGRTPTTPRHRSKETWLYTIGMGPSCVSPCYPPPICQTSPTVKATSRQRAAQSLRALARWR